jgi:hypothetical protein
MKKIVSLLLAITTYAAVSAQSADVSNPDFVKPDISKIVKFSEVDHDFGKIPFGKPAEFDIEITNISSDSITLENVQAGCGCTTPKWQAGPYAPGQTFKITVGFNGATEGAFAKTVTVYVKGGYMQIVKFHGTTYQVPQNPAPANGAVDQLKGSGF